MEHIYITSCPLNSVAEKVFNMAKNHPKLVDEITDYARRFKEANIEVFEQKDNIIVTENGYYLAFFESDLVEA